MGDVQQSLLATVGSDALEELVLGDRVEVGGA